MIARYALLGGLAAVALVGCWRRAPSTTQPASVPANDPPLTDYVVAPPVDETERDAPPLRLVSASPMVTEICCALGLRESLVGRTRYCEHPPGIERVASIGALSDTNVEALLALRSDLILVSGKSQAIADRLTSLKLRYESVPDASLDDLFAAIERIGAWTGRPRTAQRLTGLIRADIDAVTQRFARPGAGRVLLVTGVMPTPPRSAYVAGPGSFYAELLARAGWENVVPHDAAAFAPLSLEFILRSDPDAIVELDPDGAERPHGSEDALAAWSRVGPLRAVRERHLHVLVGGSHYLLGPRIAFTHRALCRALAEGAPPR